MQEYKFRVEIKKAGQRKRYGDSFYHYIVESESPLHMIESFCRKVLKPSIPSSQYKEEDIYISYCTEYTVLKEIPFLEDGYNKVEYKVTRPSTH